MRGKKVAAVWTVILLVSLGAAAQKLQSPEVAVGPQYDSTHVYVAPEDVDKFVSAFTGTFGGHSSKQVVTTVTPTPSKTSSQLIATPVGVVSLFGFQTPVPFPFGTERTGYLVKDIDVAVRAARAAGAIVLVETFPDPIGRDAILQWPGGVNMQLYWHTTPPSYPALEMVPENRVYLSPDAVVVFEKSFLKFSHGKVISDDAHAPGEEIGRAGETYRRVRIESGFGKMTLLVTDGHLPWPHGHETTGYEVADLSQVLDKAKQLGVEVLAGPYAAGERNAAMVRFPGGFVAEIHSAVK